MKPGGSGESIHCVIGRDGLQELIDTLIVDGHTVIAPRLTDGALVLSEIARVDDLPAGVSDDQEAGRYRLSQDGDGSLFAFASTAQGWKRYLYPPVERMWQARRDGAGFSIVAESLPTPRYAFLGVRACDLKAIGVLDRVFDHSKSAEPRYVARREQCLIIAVNCTRAGGTCFCTSMDSGPRVGDGADIVLTEFRTDDGAAFLGQGRSARGKAYVAKLTSRPASAAEVTAADARIDAAAVAMKRTMPSDTAAVLRRNLEHRNWAEIATHCLGCANCTMVCPTCFCGTIEDSTDLAGEVAERTRKWDSCFTNDFSYIHGGSIRRSTASRYRQWITHKLSHWWEQFGCSGCVGCGRCITWCPVGIDITEEVHKIKNSEGGAR